MLHILVANVGSTSLKYKLVSVRSPESEQAEYRRLRRVTSLYQPLHRTTCPWRVTTARHILSPRRQFICMRHPRGQSIDTSMGFSPQSGLPQTRRTGDLDPVVLLWLIEEGKAAPRIIFDSGGEARNDIHAELEYMMF